MGRGVPSGLCISPDHNTVAYLWNDALELPMVDSPRLAQNVKLFWAPLARPEWKESIPVGAAFLSHTGSSLAGSMPLVFSPDSRRIALLSGRRLLVVDLNTKQSRTLTPSGDLVSSFSWRNSTEIVYAAFTNIRGEYRETADRAFWAQPLAEPMPPRTLVRRENAIDASPETSAGAEHWSPSGHFVISMTQGRRGQFQLLEVAKKKSTTWGREDLSLRGVAWMPDDALAFCLGGELERPPQALLIEPSTGRTEDVGVPFGRDFPGFSPRIAGLGTPDGEYFVVNSVTESGCLLKVRPWQVSRLGRKLGESLGKAEQLPSWLYAAGTPGWLVNGGSPGPRYAFDYALKHVIPLGNSERDAAGREFAGNWAFDAERVITVNYSNQIGIRPVKLPSLSSRPTASSRAY